MDTLVLEEGGTWEKVERHYVLLFWVHHDDLLFPPSPHSLLEDAYSHRHMLFFPFFCFLNPSQ